MAKLYFKYSSMDAGKSSHLLQASHNYQQGGMPTLLLTAAIDDRYGKGKITSRIGLSSDAHVFSNDDDLRDIVFDHLKAHRLACVLVDESQFLTKAQVHQLARVVDVLNIPVLCYGLRTDFMGELFEGSQYLLGLADNIEEIKAICSMKGCAKKATMVLRKDADGNVVTGGEQISIGGNESYQSVCRHHFMTLTA